MTRWFLFALLIAAIITAPWAAPAGNAPRDAAARKITQTTAATTQHRTSTRLSEFSINRRSPSVPESGRSVALNYIATMDPTKLSPEFSLIRLENNHSRPWVRASGAPTNDVLPRKSGSDYTPSPTHLG